MSGMHRRYLLAFGDQGHGQERHNHPGSDVYQPSAGGFSECPDVPSIYVSMATPAPLITGVSAALRILKRKGKRPKDEEINVFAVAGD